MPSTIEVTPATRARLEALARERGDTVGELVAAYASPTPPRKRPAMTPAEVSVYIRKHLCPDLTDADLEAADRFLAEAAAGRMPSRLE